MTKNYWIENSKIIMAFMVIAIHVMSAVNSVNLIPDDSVLLAELFYWSTRLAVPFFILVNGYFWYNKQAKHRIEHLLKWQFIILTMGVLMSSILSQFAISPGYHMTPWVAWYIPFVITMMLLTWRQNNIWLIALIGILVLLGNLGLTVEYPLSTVWQYGYIFILGMFFAKYDLKIKNTSKISLFAILGLIAVLEIYNIKLENSQMTYYQCLIASLLFLTMIGRAHLPTKQWRISKYSLELFIYHSIFTAFFAYCLAHTPNHHGFYVENINFVLISVFVISSMLSFLTAFFIKWLDKIILKGEFLYAKN